MITKFRNTLFVLLLLFTACAPQTDSNPSTTTDNSAYQQSNFTLTDDDKIRYTLAVGGTGTVVPASVRINSLTSAGTYTAIVKDQAGTVLGNMPLELMKGSQFPPSSDAQFFVLSTRDGATWFKLSPRKGLDARLTAGFEALNYEAQHAGAVAPQMRVLTIAGQDYLAYQMPYYGRTVTTMVAQGAATAEIQMVYNSAFRNSLHLVTEHGIIFRDPNPGNVIELLDANGNRVGGMLIDFEAAAGVRQTPTAASIKGLQARFKNWADYYHTEFDLTIPPEIDALIIKPPAGTSVGRVFLQDAFVDFAIPLEGLDTAAVARIRNGAISYINANGVADDMTAIVIDGVEVAVTKRATSTYAKPIVQTVKSETRLISPGMINVVLLLSIGMVEVEGWNGVAIDVPYVYDTAVERGAIRGSVSYDLLWIQATTYKDQLILYARGKTVSPDDWMTTLVEPSEIGFYIESIMGMTPYDLSQLLKGDYHMTTGDVDAVIAQAIHESDMPLFMKLEFAPVPGFGGYETNIPMWISAVEDNGTQYMVLWAETYENYFNLNFGNSTGIMPMMVLERPVGGTWTVTYEDTDRLTVGFKIPDMTPNSNASCTLTSSSSDLQTYCWFEPK